MTTGLVQKKPDRSLSSTTGCIPLMQHIPRAHVTITQQNEPSARALDSPSGHAVIVVTNGSCLTSCSCYGNAVRRAPATRCPSPYIPAREHADPRAVLASLALHVALQGLSIAR